MQTNWPRSQVQVDRETSAVLQPSRDAVVTACDHFLRTPKISFLAWGDFQNPFTGTAHDLLCQLINRRPRVMIDQR